MKKLTLLLLLIPFIGLAQDKGTHFEQGLSFQKIKEKAKKENKYIFVDCSTTWCIWCKKMVAEVFPQEKVGSFFNKNFVNVEVQMDETPKDNDYVKSWRPDAKELGKYVSGYPTYLIFSSDGQLVHRIVGYKVADDFIAAAQKALDPKTQYFTLVKKYKAGDKDPDFLYSLASAALNDGDVKIATDVSSDYLNTQSNLYTEKNLKFVAQTTTSSKGKGFDVLLNHSTEVDAVLGKDKAEDMVSGIVVNEEIYSKLKRNGNNNVDSLAQQAKAKYPTVNLAKSILMAKIQVYKVQKDWDKFQLAVLAYMETYGTDVKPNMLNDFAWTVFENCQDPECVSKAIEWSKRGADLTGNKDPMILDTYANLLYKSGKSKEAIEIEEKAMALAAESDKAEYSTTLEKMKKGEKTWVVK